MRLLWSREKDGEGGYCAKRSLLRGYGALKSAVEEEGVRGAMEAGDEWPFGRRERE